MPNMSYCRFRNTLAALRDCFDHMEETLSESEENAREALIRLCEQIAEEYADAT